MKKAWTKVSATDSESDGRSLAMFFKWKKADLVTDLMWEWKERVESKLTIYNIVGERRLKYRYQIWTTHSDNKTFLVVRAVNNL